MAVGILLALFGFWVIMRTVNRDATQRTLVDRILGVAAGGKGAHA